MSKQQSRVERLKAKQAKKIQAREIRKLALIAIPIILIAAIILALYYTNQATVDEDLLIRPDSPMLGSNDAPVTLVEFLDPECESCRALYPVVKQILAAYEGQLRLVVRYFPNHNNSVLAAAATEAAGAQGQYWEMQELLFERQIEWGEQRTPQTQLFISYAQVLGLDTRQFISDLENPVFLERIERDRQDATTLGLTGTPTFFVNGRLVRSLSYEGISAMIEAELR